MSRKSSLTIDRLTGAEERVAALVATGASNADIAQHLIISRHTVESHLRHIYIKLAIKSRVQLAVLIAGRNLVLS